MLVLATLAFTLAPSHAGSAPHALAARLGSESPSSPHVRVDAFGYRPGDPKIAVLREPVVGHDAPAPYAPGAVIQLRRASDDAVVFSAAPSAWGGGAVHAQSGDRVWWFDFSAVTAPGEYVVHDPATGARSERFAIRRDVYDQALRDALRFYAHQRCGAAKAEPFIEAPWTDGACHTGAGQDLACRPVADPGASGRDLSGGWHDAGDYNKYVNYAAEPVHDLLFAYEEQPRVFGDDLGIPESGNGLPDILDEVRWELEWLLKMQEPNGSVLHKISVTDFSAASPPSADTGARFHAPATASATISACGVFAHAARVYRNLPQPSAQSLSAELEAAAVAAWSWLLANEAQVPSSFDNAGFVNAAAENSAYDQELQRVCAAGYLFALTGAAPYRDFFDAGVGAAHLFTWSWAATWEHEIQDGLLAYSRASGATPSVASAIRSAYAADLSGPDHLGYVDAGEDAYRAFLHDQDHTWGSNRVKARQGLMYLHVVREGLDPARRADHLAAAAGYLHYVHGVNPPGHCYLTRMQGAPSSVTETYHAWFADGTAWDSTLTSLHGPPPGILVGGVNVGFAPNPAYTGPPLEPPMNQPVQKSYRDWNAGWPEESWEVTECHIPYQASYVRLLAAFAAGPERREPGNAEPRSDVPRPSGRRRPPVVLPPR